MAKKNTEHSPENDALLQGAIDVLTGHIAILDGAGNIIKVNRAWGDLSGHDPNDAQNFQPGANYIEACSNLENDPIGKNLAEGIKDVIDGRKEIFEIEYPFQKTRETSEIRWYATRVARFGTDENLRVVVTHENITPRKSAEDALRESEESYRILAETASDVIIKIDSNSRILFINRAAERIFGYKLSEMLGQSLTMLMPDDLRQKHEDGIAGYLKTGERTLSWDGMEVLAQRKDKSVFPLEISFGESDERSRHFFIGVARDISGRKEAEKVTAHLAEIVRSSDDAIISKDLNGIITSWNKGAEKIFGYAADEAVGKSITLLIPTHLLDEEKTILSRIRQGIDIKHYNTIRQCKDGRNINVSLTVSPIRDRRGEIIGASKIARDITERVRIEQSLRENQMMLALAMQSSRMGAWERDIMADVVIWSEELEEIFGLEKGAFGESYEAYYKLVHEDDRERIHREVQNAVNEHRDYSIEFRFHHADGSIRWMEGRGQAVYSKKGEPVRLYGIGIDITERKETEEKLLKAERKAAEDYQMLLSRIVPVAQTLGTARDLISIYRTVGAFIRASMPCAAFFVSFYEKSKNLRIAAYVCGEEGEIDISQLPPMTLTADGGPNSQAIFQKKTVIVNRYMDLMRNRPHVIVQEDGIDPNSSVVVPMKVMNRIIGTFEVQSYAEDAFTEEHVVALEMVANLAAVAIENVRLLEVEAKARQEAEAANRAKDEFLSVLSHELRTPLNAMLGWTRMMKSGALDEAKMKQAIETIERNARLQNNLIEDLLDVSRIISAKMRIETEQVDIVSIVKTCVETAKPSAEEKNISLTLKSDSPSLNISGDATRLQQIVNNLLQNAVKFTPAGGLVSVDLKGLGDRFLLKVTDTGIGIAPDFLSLIFDRFRQADSTTRRSHSGLGLGLTIVRHLTELHGGKIEASSRGENLGAVFTVELPLATSPDETASSVETPLQNQNPARLKGAKILLVDDDCEGVQPLQFFLETQEAEVDCADSAAAALQKINEKRFDILVSDIGMPEMDGYEFIVAARKLTGEKYFLPAIALTAYASTQDREKALMAGYQAHLSKPVDFEQFLAAINNLLDRQN